MASQPWLRGPQRRSSGVSGRLAALLASLRPKLRAWARGRLPPAARRRVDTEDLVQDALLGALRNSDALDPEQPGDVDAYLRQSIRNRIRDEIRWLQNGEVRATRQDLRADPDAPAFDRIAIAQQRRIFRKALCQLPERERELVVGCVELHLTYAELAAALGLPSAEAARSAARRAIFHLAKISGALNTAAPPTQNDAAGPCGDAGRPR